jgi:hypothetical protein
MKNQKHTEITTLAQLLRKSPIQKIDEKEAERRWIQHRIEHGFAGNAPLFTPPDANIKFEKTKERAIYGISLAQHRLSGLNVCPNSTPECRKWCLGQNGKGGIPAVVNARVVRTLFLFRDPEAFVTLVAKEIKRCRVKHGDRFAIRLNTLSDVPWEYIAPWLFEENYDIWFYDYTKNQGRLLHTPQNYWLTFSASERTTEQQIVEITDSGRNVAVVFNDPLPKTYLGYTVIDGDKSDARFLDPCNVIIGLKAKGSLRTSNSAFKVVAE